MTRRGYNSNHSTDDRNDDGDCGNDDETDGHDYSDYEGTVASLLLLNNHCFHIVYKTHASTYTNTHNLIL